QPIGHICSASSQFERTKRRTVKSSPRSDSADATASGGFQSGGNSRGHSPHLELRGADKVTPVYHISLRNLPAVGGKENGPETGGRGLSAATFRGPYFRVAKGL